ncbi:MAG: hypothetical protein IKC10_01600 [Alphaproteobacteria bacterium]|nr:hypothetical protein [Alphaproteobacteria bacterium]
MKKYFMYILFLLIITTPAKAQMPWDLIYHAVPVSIGIDVPENIVQISGNVQTTVRSAKDVYMTALTDASSLQSAVTGSFNKVKSSAILDVEGNPGQEKTGFCGQDLDEVEVKTVAEKVKDVLWVLKSKDFIYKEEHKKQREKFYMDNTYAIHAASIITLQELENDIKALIDKAKSCAEGKGNECNIPSTDEGGLNEVIFTYGKTLEALDSVIRLWESVAALKARLTVIKMMDKITPAQVVDGEEDVDEISFMLPQSTMKLHNSTPLSFAQLNADYSIDNTIEKVEATAVMKNEGDAMRYITNTIDFVSPDINEAENALALVQKEMDDLKEMNEVEKMVASAIEVHNFIKEMPQHKETEEQYLEMKQKYKEAFERLVLSEECAIKYLGKYYTKPHTVWSGDLPLKNADKHELRKGISGWAFNAFELLKSGEVTDAFTAFSVAKEQQVADNTDEEDDSYLTDEEALNEKIEDTMRSSSTQPDEIAQDSMSNEEITLMADEPDQYLDIDGKRYNEDSSNKTINNSISANKKNNANAEARKTSMMQWQVGSEASKLLGDPSQDWGSQSTGVKLIWNDTKRFYRKYLEMKYSNILRYMKSYSQADLLELIAKKMVGDSQSAQNSSYQQNRKAKLAELNSESINKLSEKLEQKRSNRSMADNEIKKIENKKLKIEAQINELNEELRLNKEEINTIKLNETDKALGSVKQSLTASVEFPTKNETPSSKKVGKLDAKEMTTTVNASSSKSVAENSDIKKKEKRNKEIKEKLDRLERELTETNTNIKIKKLEAQAKGLSDEDLDENSLSAEEELMAKLNGSGSNVGALAAMQEVAKGNALTTIKNVLIDSNNQNPIEGFDVDEAIKGINDGAESVVLKAQEMAQKIIIEEGLNKLYALGEDLYTEASYPQIEKIHNDMINNLKAVNLTFTAAEQLISPVLSVNNLLVFSEFLEGMDTSPELDDFFVGATPKDRDLKAPFKLRGFDLPPVREVFHFDAVDYTNMKPAQNEDSGDEEDNDWLDKLFEKSENKASANKKRYIDKEDFLNYGGYIPPIWEHMLKDFPFVESRLPLKDVLGDEDGECETVTFSRGGVMPCLYGNGKYVMDVNKKSNFINDEAKDKDKNLSACASVKNNGGKAYHPFWKVNLSEWVLKDDVPPSNCEYSELGLLFEADKHNNLYIRKTPFKNFNRVNRLGDKDINKMLPKRKKNLAAAKISELSRNQIGDFLKQAEVEKKSKENLEEAEAEYEKSKEAVYALFEEQGFVPSKDFSLSNKDDYNQAIKVLKTVKNQRLDKATKALEAVNAKEDDRLAEEKQQYKEKKEELKNNKKSKKKLKKPEKNKPLNEKSKNMKKLIDFMDRDNDCILKISMADADSNDLNIRLIKETANVKLLDKFKKKTEENKKDSADVEEVYCAIY